MKFYNREKELDHLNHLSAKAKKGIPQMVFVVGRRRIGKTSLLLKSVEKEDFIYFFIARKSEALLCEDFIAEIRQKLKIEVYGDFKTFRNLFGFLMELSKSRHFTLIVDEFQEFRSVNPSVYGEIQRIWDLNKSDSKLNLILCGSVYSMMTQLFEHAKEPLFGRATARIHLKNFSVSTLKEILHDHYPDFTAEDLLAFFAFTGGVAKYIELLIQEEAFTFETMLDTILSDNSLFLEEGKNVLIEEFGKDYGNYFSILSLIASSKTSRVEIESILEMQTGGYLDRLENEYGVIKKVKPIFAKLNSRSVKYFISDNFLNFWFRYLFKYKSAVEIGNLELIKQAVKWDYALYSGEVLEKYFTEKLASENNFTAIGRYWERGNLNEIDIVAVNHVSKKVQCIEVKRQKKNIRVSELKRKSEKLILQNQDFAFSFMGLSMEDL